MKKVAIFVDWENLRQEIEYICKNPKYSVRLTHEGRFLFNYNNLKHLTLLLNKFIDAEKEDLYSFRRS